ncbi:MAG: RNA polymerase sigma factor [Acutalibacteraceae bacterium]
MDKVVKMLKKHDERALEQIMSRYTPLVATIIFNISNGSLSSADIEEAVADVFITLWNNTDKVQPDKLKGYICCIAKSKAKNKLRSLKPIQSVDIDEVTLADDFSVSENIEQDLLNSVLKEIINTILEPDKEILIRHYYYYQSVSKISNIMNINVETVKSKIQRTRAKIKRGLEERGYVK